MSVFYSPGSIVATKAKKIPPTEVSGIVVLSA